MKLVCFDLGGVLVRITLRVPEAAARAGLEHLDVPNVGFGDLACVLDYQAGRIDTTSYLRQLAEVLHGTEGEALAVHNHIPIEPYPGTLELVRSLKVRTACLSNTNGLHWNEMLHSGRFPNVEALQLKVASHVLSLEKPDPAIFARFEELAGVGGDDILLFDDGPLNVAAARLVGWQSELIDPAGDTAAQMRKHLESRGIHAVS